jgi:hypothetical protein
MYFQKKEKSGTDVVGETETRKRMREIDIYEAVEER